MKNFKHGKDEGKRSLLPLQRLFHSNLFSLFCIQEVLKTTKIAEFSLPVPGLDPSIYPLLSSSTYYYFPFVINSFPCIESLQIEEHLPSKARFKTKDKKEMFVGAHWTILGIKEGNILVVTLLMQYNIVSKKKEKKEGNIIPPGIVHYFGYIVSPILAFYSRQ